MKFRFLSLLALVGVFSLVAAAADVSGTYTAEIQGKKGPQTTTIVLKADGAALSGTVSGRGGETPITDGKVDGSNVSFTVKREFNGNSMVSKYAGMVEGDTLKLTMTMTTPDGQERKAEIAAKRK